MVILLMTDLAVDNFVNGKMNVGGSGGFAVGTLGMGASGAGGIKGGLELIIVSTNEGAFLGSGMTDMTPAPATALNDLAYGRNADIKSILSGTGGKYAPAIPVRAALSTMVTKAWDIPAN